MGVDHSGKANLNINAKFDIDNIDRLLKVSYIASRSKRYEDKGFAWIDKIDLIKKGTLKHSQLITELDSCIAGNSSGHKIWLAVPELVDWQDISGFYFNGIKDTLFEDVTLDALKQIVTDDLTVQVLQSVGVGALHADGTKTAYSWTAYECLYAEVELDNETYILINAEWYRLKGDFIADTNSRYQNIISNHSSAVIFKDYLDSDVNENGYNSNMASQIANAVCMDAQNISHGGRYNKVEFCDIFDRDGKKIIHVKKYSGSSVLSHLFAQGFVSAQLLINDSDFRTKVESKIQSRYISLNRRCSSSASGVLSDF